MDFPNVPNVPGVPPIPRNPAAAIASVIALLTGDNPSLPNNQAAPTWGIFDQDGNSIVAADNVVKLEYRQDWAIADFPVENGGFASYDKVATPFEARFLFSRGGSTQDRQDFLDSIAAIAGDFNLYNVVMPEETYQNVNINHYDYSRTATDGVGLMKVSIYVQEIRETVAAAFSNTVDPTSAGQSNNGTVQTAPPTPQQQSALSSFF